MGEVEHISETCVVVCMNGGEPAGTSNHDSEREILSVKASGTCPILNERRRPSFEKPT